MSDILSRIDTKFDSVKSALANHIIRDDGCWEYQGYKDHLGYGKINIYAAHLNPKKRSYRASRVAYAFYTGADPDFHFVCHTCDNPSCINPDHLYLGTPADNMQDTVDRERRPVGEAQHSSKLKETDVLKILDLGREGEPLAKIARQFGVSRMTIRNILAGKKWRKLLEAAGYNPEQHRRRVA